MMSDERSGSSIDDRGLDRILSLSDGIFAFAITLLVLNLTVPTLNQAATSTDLLSSLWTESSKFIAYIVSFYVISNYWLAHHRVFRYVKKYDSRLIQLNLFFLLFITLVPFFTQLISSYGSLESAEEIFYLSQALGGALLTLLWIHASKDFLLIEQDTPKALIRWVTVRGLISPAVFLAAAVVALFIPSYSSLTLIAISPVSRILVRKYGYKMASETQKGPNRSEKKCNPEQMTAPRGGSAQMLPWHRTRSTRVDQETRIETVKRLELGEANLNFLVATGQRSYVFRTNMHAPSRSKLGWFSLSQ